MTLFNIFGNAHGHCVLLFLLTREVFPSGICRSWLSLVSPGSQSGHAAPAAAAATAAAPAQALPALRVPPGLWQVRRLSLQGCEHHPGACSCSGVTWGHEGWTAAVSDSDVGVYFQFANIFLPSRAGHCLGGDQSASSLLCCWWVQQGFQTMSGVDWKNIECSLNVKFRD